MGRTPRQQTVVTSQLETAAEFLQWDLSRDRVLNVTRAIYLPLRSDAKLWRMGREFGRLGKLRLKFLAGPGTFT